MRRVQAAALRTELITHCRDCVGTACAASLPKHVRRRCKWRGSTSTAQATSTACAGSSAVKDTCRMSRSWRWGGTQLPPVRRCVLPTRRAAASHCAVRRLASRAIQIKSSSGMRLGTVPPRGGALPAASALERSETQAPKVVSTEGTGSTASWAPTSRALRPLPPHHTMSAATELAPNSPLTRWRPVVQRRTTLALLGPTISWPCTSSPHATL